MAKLTNKEREIKAECVKCAFEVLKSKSEKTGIDYVTIPAIVKLANNDEKMKAFEEKIGDKSIYSKAKNSIYKPLLNIINNWKIDFEKKLSMTDSSAKKKLENMNFKLEDSEIFLIELQEEILHLKEVLENKDSIIIQIEKDRNQYALELAKLRRHHE